MKQSARQKALLTEAKNLGIKSPERLDEDQLKMAMSIFRKIHTIYQQANHLGISLPQGIVNLGQIERLFKKAVADRLKAIQKGVTVRYKSEPWVVERIIETPRSKRGATYVLRPEGGGRTIKVSDTALLLEME